MDRHTPFILASYGICALVLAGVIASIVYDHIRLKKALTRFPARDSDETGA